LRNKTALRTLIEHFNNVDFEAKNVATQIGFEWYDWFCKDSNLENKTKRMRNNMMSIRLGLAIFLYKQN